MVDLWANHFPRQPSYCWSHGKNYQHRGLRTWDQWHLWRWDFPPSLVPLQFDSSCLMKCVSRPSCVRASLVTLGGLLACQAPPAMSHRIPPVALVADASSWLMPLLLMHLNLHFLKGIDLDVGALKSLRRGGFWYGWMCGPIAMDSHPVANMKDGGELPSFCPFTLPSSQLDVRGSQNSLIEPQQEASYTMNIIFLPWMPYAFFLCAESSDPCFLLLIDKLIPAEGFLVNQDLRS